MFPTTHSPLPTKAYTTLVPEFEKHPLFGGFWTKKTPLFEPKSLILRPYKIPLFHNISYSTLFVKVRIYVTASNSRHFPCTSYFSLLINYGYSSNTFMHNYWNMRNKQMVINTCQILPQNFADSCLQNDPYLSADFHVLFRFFWSFASTLLWLPRNPWSSRGTHAPSM